MNTILTYLRSATLSLAAAMLVSGQALALPLAQPEAPAVVVPAAANCNAVGRQVASSMGGKLISASPGTQGGRTVCKLVIAVPANDGGPPTLVNQTVPAE